METMFEKVQAILARQLRVDPAKVVPEAQIKKDLGADSLDILQLLMRIEDQYGIVIPDRALATFETVADVVAYLEKEEAGEITQ
jgi:acyl carrier protein